MSDSIPRARDVAFTLSCVCCDADSPDTFEEAVQQGWTDIKYAPEGSSENFIGLCANCGPILDGKVDEAHQLFRDIPRKGDDACPT